MVKWIPYDGPAQGTTVKGDPNVPPTPEKSWLKWLMPVYVFVLWRKVTVFEVMPKSMAERGYKIGSKNVFGENTLRNGFITGYYQFKVRNGREDCTFFAVDHNGKEILLTLITQTTKNDPEYKGVPLY